MGHQTKITQARMWETRDIGEKASGVFCPGRMAARTAVHVATVAAQQLPALKILRPELAATSFSHVGRRTGQEDRVAVRRHANGAHIYGVFGLSFGRQCCSLPGGQPLIFLARIAEMYLLADLPLLPVCLFPFSGFVPPLLLAFSSICIFCRPACVRLTCSGNLFQEVSCTLPRIYYHTVSKSKRGPARAGFSSLSSVDMRFSFSLHRWSSW